MKGISDQDLAIAWDAAESLEEVIEEVGLRANTIEKRVRGIRKSGIYMKPLPAIAGGKARKLYERKKKLPLAKGIVISRTPPAIPVPVEDKKEICRDVAIYAAAVYDLCGDSDPIRRQDGSLATRIKIVSTKDCAIQLVHDNFGGEIRSLEGTAKLIMIENSAEVQAFLSAILPHAKCNVDEIRAIVEFMEWRLMYLEAEQRLGKVFGI